MHGAGIKYLIYGLAAVALIWLLLKFLLPWAAPFLLAYALAAVLELPMGFLLRHGWRRSGAAGLLSIGLLGLVGWGIGALSVKGVEAVTDFAKRVPELMGSVGQLVEKVQGRIFMYIEETPEGVREYLETAVDSLGQGLYKVPTIMSQWALDALSRIAQASPDILLFIVTAGIGTYFISAAYPRTTAFITAQLPERLRCRLEGLEQDIKTSFGGFFRAQLILLLMTFFQLLVAFSLLGVSSPLGLAAITALVDALPVFGTGVVLLPWAAYCLLLGSTGRGLGLLICWGVVNLVRSCAQAKLVGDQMGLNPIASLLAVYVGWQVWGVWGMLFFPLGLAALQQLNDHGVIRLWKRV